MNALKICGERGLRLVKVEIKVVISKEEFDQYCKDYYDLNEELPSSEDIGEEYAEYFIADHSDYLRGNIITVVRNGMDEKIIYTDKD